MTRFGFKEILVDNWLEADLVMLSFVKISPEGESVPMSGEDWIASILNTALDETVPDDVQALFEVARGAMIYGYFFYPLYTLAAEQLFRVAESAVHQKCKSLNSPSSVRSYSRRIDWLVANGVIPREEVPRWHNMRELRNAASHPVHQTIVTPGNAIGILERAAESINQLFCGTNQLTASDGYTFV